MLIEIARGEIIDDCAGCPNCKNPLENPVFDRGDRIFVDKSKFPTLSFYARFDGLVCPICNELAYEVLIESIDNPNVSDEWKEKYFWRNIPFFEQEEPLVYYYYGDNERVPPRWQAYSKHTPEGIVITHTTGLFLTRDYVYGPHGLPVGCWGTIMSKHTVWVVEAILTLVYFNKDIIGGEECFYDESFYIDRNRNENLH